jgi:hypothetical protein
MDGWMDEIMVNDGWMVDERLNNDGWIMDGW